MNDNSQRVQRIAKINTKTKYIDNGKKGNQFDIRNFRT
jgi:hypothetical protein